MNWAATLRGMKKRAALKVLAATGIGTAVFQRSLAAEVVKPTEVSDAMVREAEWIAGITLTDEERQTVAKSLTRTLKNVVELRELPIDYSVSPAFSFAPRENSKTKPIGEASGASVEDGESIKLPSSEGDLAFLPVTALSELVRTRQITSMELTELYLERLKRFDPVLNCVVSFTEDLAMEQARRADHEIAEGNYRGPLHGIPWGAKDLIAYPRYRTTWGAAHYKEQQLEHKATGAARLDDAGAVLVAKLTLGALAEGDQWFGGMTRNPWNPKQGSSGSSAGSASAVAAGLVGFAIGSETLGSIVSPCSRCGATGLRPTFGRVSRYGCMPLSWTMDKLGPIARTVDDCGLIFGVIHGADPLDQSAVSRPFTWPPKSDVSDMTVGYFEGQDDSDLKPLRELGVNLVSIDLPGRELAQKLAYLLSVEAAAAFDEVTAAGISDGFNNWAERFRSMRFVPAVDYIRANRLRSQLMDDVAKATENVDAWMGGNDLVVTNLTGHPTVVIPHGMKKGKDDVPVPKSVTFSGQPYADEALLALVAAYQKKTGHHFARPPLMRNDEFRNDGLRMTE